MLEKTRFNQTKLPQNLLVTHHSLQLDLLTSPCSYGDFDSYGYLVLDPFLASRMNGLII